MQNIIIYDMSEYEYKIINNKIFIILKSLNINISEKEEKKEISFIEKLNDIDLIKFPMVDSKKNDLTKSKILNISTIEYNNNYFNYNGSNKYTSILHYIILLLTPEHIQIYKQICKFNIVSYEYFDKGYKPIKDKNGNLLFSIQNCDANKTYAEIEMLKTTFNIKFKMTILLASNKEIIL